MFIARLRLLLPLLICLLLAQVTVHAQALPEASAPAPTSADTLQVYNTGGRTTFAIAIPAFNASGAMLPGEDLSSIIMTDLKLSGFFRPPDNATFASETEQLDKQRNTINFAEWHRIGVSFLVKGDYTINGTQLTAEVKTYDTVSQTYIFGKRYEQYEVGESRRLAHQISDDILKRLLDVDGNSRSRLLFVKKLDPYGKTKQVCVMDSDGYGPKALTSVGELTATPAWGAHGTEIYYTTYKDFNPDLAGMILKSGATWWISRRTGFNLSPSWSETKQLIALVLTKDGNSEIYTLQRDGKNLKRITNNKAIDEAPTWSPDGTKIAFTSDRTGSPQIWIKDLATDNDTRLTFHSSYNDAATWAPAGPPRIAFCSRVDGNFQIFTCKPDGSDLKQLTNGDYNNEDPTWAPNGLELAFTSNRSGRNEIYRMAADGSNVNQITTQGDCQSPAWSPLIP